MTIMHDPLRLHIAERIFSTLPEEARTSLSVEALYDQLVEPPNPDLGDLAFGCFIFAKALRMAPAKIAADLADKIHSDEVIEKATATGPYLNFSICIQASAEKVLEPLLNHKLFTRSLIKDSPKTMIEYSQPNTHKELHVGHMRNLCLGDALVRLMRYSGYELISTTFPGDVGTHVAKCLWYMKNHNTEPVPETGQGEWLGRMYSKAHIKLEDELGTDKEAENRAQLTAILQQLENKSGPYYDLWKETRQWSIELMQRIYNWADVQFDHWYWESDVDSSSTQYARELYKQGQLIESQGAIGMDLSEDKLGFCMLLKSDGTGLYATKDVELARRKFADHQIELSIYVVDMRQALHFQQVFKVLEKLGFEQAKNCYHLQYNFVELPDGAMSSRKGNIVPITELIQQMEDTVKDQYLNRYQGEWNQDEIDLVAKQVAMGAIKYGMVRMDNNKKIVFDMKEWLKIEGESGPFVQYSSARISSLIRRLNYDPQATVDWSALEHSAEKRLINRLMHFNTVVLAAAQNYKPAILCAYLFNLAKDFNLFYHECPIGKAPSESIRTARLALSSAVGEALKKGLSLLGIPAPERM